MDTTTTKAYRLQCGDGSIGCGATTEVERIGDEAGGFDYEHFNGGYYICPNQCDDANVDVYLIATGEEIEYPSGGWNARLEV